jgi:hypothetical protein
MSHTQSRTRPFGSLFVATLAIAASLAATSALWAHGPGGSRGGAGGSRSGSMSGRSSNNQGRATPGKVSGSKGNTYRGQTYSHNVFSKHSCGWSRRGWCPSLNRWVYWCPSEGCWYIYEAADETFVPLDTWTNENRQGIQYGP